MAGKAVVFHVKVNEVKEKQVPALDDEFAKDVSELDTINTIKDLKADLKKKIEEKQEETARQGFEDLLMQQVADNLTCEVPEAMVQAQAKRFLDNFRMQLQSQGLQYEQIP